MMIYFNIPTNGHADYRAFLDSKANLGDGHGFEPIEIWRVLQEIAS